MLDLSMLFSCSVVAVIGWVTYKIYIWPYYVSPLRKIPGPPSDHLFYGNLKRLLFIEETGEPQLRWINKYGNIVKYHGVFNKPVVLVSDTEIIKDILLNQAYEFPKPSGELADLATVLGKGLVLVEGDTHKRQRKMMNPAFSHNNIKGMVPIFVRVASTLKGIIEDEVDKGESKVILTSYISKATLDIIGLAGFNYEFNSLTSQNELAEAYDTIMNTPITALNVIISVLANYIPLIRKVPIDANIKFNKAIQVIERVSKKLIEEKCNEAENDKLNGDLLSLLTSINKTLPIEEKMTDDELKYQIMTFLAAGHDTTSTATSWALCFLAQNPRDQDLLREELVKAFPNKSEINPTFDEINSLEYLNCIVKETLRLIPPVGIIRRHTLEDRVIGGYFIPKGTSFTIPIAALHRLPSIWGPTADNFDPKRWLNPIKDVTNFNYIPFITGTRSCIGSKLATTEFKILLSTLIRNFVFQPVEGLRIRKKAGLISKPEPYLELIVSKVEA